MASNSSNDYTPKFIFDANFFIALKEIKANRPYHHLSLAREKLNMEFYVSGAVFNECPFITGTDFQEFSKGVSIELVKDDELERVKNDLKKRGVRMLAQDPDLTLVALGHRLRLSDDRNDIFIVSDDFKLSQNIEALGYRIKCLPLPSFVQILGDNLKGTEARYWKTARKKILKLNLDYMMSRSQIYPPQAKIAWLIENAVDIAGQGIKLKINEDEGDKKEESSLREEKELFEICQDYISGKVLNSEKKERIKPYLSVLNEIKRSREILQKAKGELMQSHFKQALKYLKSAKMLMSNTLQLSGAGKLNEAHYQFAEKILASELSKIIFLRAFVYIEANKVANALSDLDDTALFSTISRFPQTVLTLNYIKAILYVFNGIYTRSIKQFHFINQLARSYGDPLLRLKSTIGESIILYLTDQKEKAISLVNKTKENLDKKSLPMLMTALIDSGDYFLAMGFPEIATNLYMKSIELALDLHLEWRIDSILEKMKGSFMASALVSTETRPIHHVAVLIDQWYQMDDLTRYNEVMNKFIEFTNKLYEPFEYLTPKKKRYSSYLDLPEEMRGEWKCVRIYDEMPDDHTLLVGYKEEIGLIGFDLVTDKIFEAVPENYTIEIKKSAKVKIVPPDPDRPEHLLCRAIVKCTNEKKDLTITRQIPILFKQLQI